MDFKDYYKTLGVSKTATEKEIKSAYRKLARENHPDVNSGDKGAEKRFQEINEAYEVLSDADNRKKYDQLGSQWRNAGSRRGPGSGGSGGVEFDFSDLFGGAGGHQEAAGGFSSFFERFFGGAGRQTRGGPQPQPEQPASVEVEVSLAEAYSGTTRQLEIASPQVCPQCRGAGVIGNGICPICRGAGRQQGTRRLEVRIPAGVTQGSKVKAQGVTMVINIRPDPDYEIKGRDVIRKTAVDLYGAVLGTEVSFRTPSGKEVSLKVPPESQNGRSFRLSGQGLPAAAGKQAGDLYVKLEVSLPTRLTAREKELFEELARLRA
ncbi:MAG: J domain-containing protein [Candidatus Eremiobacteraeota bacterium]|nr:J domain-containing protein [Candidatus Eremiobacteraeota bacterium]MCW5866134.1 J domain-containing protein [Candidatus Eremiobacteraeota bacterium]